MDSYMHLYLWKMEKGTLKSHKVIATNWCGCRCLFLYFRFRLLFVAWCIRIDKNRLNDDRIWFVCAYFICCFLFIITIIIVIFLLSIVSLRQYLQWMLVSKCISLAFSICRHTSWWLPPYAHSLITYTICVCDILRVIVFILRCSCKSVQFLVKWWQLPWKTRTVSICKNVYTSLYLSLSLRVFFLCAIVMFAHMWFAKLFRTENVGWKTDERWMWALILHIVMILSVLRFSNLQR